MTSLFTAVLATQAVLGTMQRSPLITHPNALGAGESKRRWTQDFMGASKWFFSMSGVILLIGALAIGGKGLNFGIDFESGTRAKAAFVDSARPRTRSPTRCSPPGFTNPEVQKVQGDKELGGNGIQISLGETGTKVSGVEQILTVEVRRDQGLPAGLDRPDVRQDGGEDRRSSRSSRRCWSSASTSRCGSSGSSPCRC